MIELRSFALKALLIADPDRRCAAVRVLASFDRRVDPQVELAEPAGVPGRPERPVLVAPGAVAPRSVHTREGHAALLHALAHIEFNAIGLALDHLWRFARLPERYYRDWAGVAVEEAQHFLLLRQRLRDLGFDYGDFPAHDGLWEMARRTSDDVLSRMALVPRTLEARGLDASPAVREKFVTVGDAASARIIDVILRDEIGHVGIGSRWFRHVCALRGLEPLWAQQDLARRLNAPRQRGKVNVTARLQAGFTVQEIEALHGDP